jgi:hypothetical protein
MRESFSLREFSKKKKIKPMKRTSRMMKKSFLSFLGKYLKVVVWLLFLNGIIHCGMHLVMNEWVFVNAEGRNKSYPITISCRHYDRQKT